MLLAAARSRQPRAQLPSRKRRPLSCPLVYMHTRLQPQGIIMYPPSRKLTHPGYSALSYPLLRSGRLVKIRRFTKEELCVLPDYFPDVPGRNPGHETLCIIITSALFMVYFHVALSWTKPCGLSNQNIFVFHGVYTRLRKGIAHCSCGHGIKKELEGTVLLRLLLLSLVYQRSISRERLPRPLPHTGARFTRCRTIWSPNTRAT